jgi:hypothetical protein
MDGRVSLERRREREKFTGVRDDGEITTSFAVEWQPNSPATRLTARFTLLSLAAIRLEGKKQVMIELVLVCRG